MGTETKVYLCFLGFGVVTHPTVSRQKLVLHSRMFLGSTKHPATWQNKTTDVCKTYFVVASLGNPDTVIILLMFAVSTIIPTANLVFIALSYYGIEGVWVVSRACVTMGEFSLYLDS